MATCSFSIDLQLWAASATGTANATAGRAPSAIALRSYALGSPACVALVASGIGMVVSLGILLADQNIGT